MKISTYVGAVLAVALLAAACGSDSDGGEFGLVQEGTLTVCTDTPYPPMEFEDGNGGYTGFDIELMRAIATDIGLELDVTVPGWEAITSGLAMETDMCDISASSITITPEREENIDFSDSYFEADQSLLVAADSGIGSIDDVGTLAVQTGTTGEIWAQDNGPDGMEIISFETAGDLYLALDAGTAQGVMTDLVGNQGYVDENPGVATVAATYETGEEYGLAVKEEGSEALLEAVNASLSKLQGDGTYDALFAEWFSG